MTEKATPTSPIRRRTALLWVIACLLVFAILSYSAAMQKCATFDEPLHAVSGAIIRNTADYRIDVEDPALFTLISSFPHGGNALRIDTNSEDFQAVGRDHSRQWVVAIDTLYHTSGNDGIAYVNRSRFVFMLIGVTLGAVLSFWAYKLSGLAAAMIVATLYAFDPNFLAHASLIKNDIASALLILWLICSLWLIGQQITPLRVAAICLACALAINIKFTGLICGPLVVVLLLIRAALPKPWKIGSQQIESKGERVGIAIGISAIAAIAAWGLTWAIYAADRSSDADWLPIIRDAKVRLIQVGTIHGTFNQPSDLDAIPDPLTVKILSFAHRHHVLPHNWLTGFLYTYDTTIDRPTYLLGRRSLTGWWYYFPLAMLFKTPLTIFALALIASGLAIFTRKLAPRPAWDLICLWLPIAIYGGSAMMSNLNLGIRHILPIYPFIYILIAMPFSNWLNRSHRNARSVLIVAMLILAGETLWVWPNFIPFFNAAAGGAEGGLKLLGDSNLDWGQDLPLLAQWYRRQTYGLRISYFGTVDPTAYHISYLEGGYAMSPQPLSLPTSLGTFAISATNLQGIYLSPAIRAQNADLLAYLQQQKPFDVLGGSIYMYSWSPEKFARFVQQRHSPT